MAETEQELLLYPRQVARMLKCDDHTVYKMLDDGELGYIPRGKNRRMVPVAEVHAWINRKTQRAG